MSDGFEPRTIILVEDNRSTRRVVRDLLNDYDTPIELLEAESGEALIELCRSHHTKAVDLIILDLNLISPYKHGLSGLGAIQKLSPAIPFIVLTVDSTVRSIRAALAAGALGYCVKPPTAENLIPTIEVALMLAHSHSLHIAAGALMALHHLSEDEAMATLKTAGATNRRMARDTAQSVLDALEAARYLYRLTPS